MLSAAIGGMRRMPGMGRLTRMAGRRMLMRGRVGFLGTSGVVVIIVLLIAWRLYQNRRRRQNADTAPLTPEAAAALTTLVYAVNDALTAGDMRALGNLTTPAGLRRLRHRAALQNLAVVATNALDDRRRVVELQARRGARLTRFEQVWTVVFRDDRLLVDKIAE